MKNIVYTKEWNRVERDILRHKGDTHVRVGVLSSKGGNADHGGATVVEIATIHEFGAPKAGIPERSFIRRTFIVKERDLAKVTSKLARLVVTGKFTMDRALDMLGAWGASEVKKTITIDGVPPPLKEETIRRKGSDRTLVDTGQLLNSIQWAVEL